MTPRTVRRAAPLAAAAAVLAVLGGTAYALREPGSSGAGSDAPSPLRLTSITTTADSTNSTGSTGSTGYRDDRFSLVGALPPGPDEAPVHRLEDASDADVRQLAVALGLDEPTDDSGGRVARSGDSTLVVDGIAGSPWRYGRDDASWCVEPQVTNAEDVVGCAVEPDSSSGDRPGSGSVAGDAARAAARDVLRAAGLGGSTVATTRTDQLVTLSADPVVAGLPTSGLTTLVSVDGDGVATAQGWLGGASQGSTYPLVSARQAYDRLVSTPMPVPLIACAEPGPAEKDADAPEDADPLRCGGAVEVTGATFGLSLQWEGERPLLVPSWLFDVAGASQPLVQVAVDPDYLAAPDAQTDPGSSDPTAAVPPTSVPGSQGSGEPGFPGSGTPVEPGEPDAPTMTTRFESVANGEGPRELVVAFYGGVEACYTYAVEAEESSRQVRLVLVETAKAGEGACPDLAQRYERTVRLAEPVGDRRVMDAETGDRLDVSG